MVARSLTMEPDALLQIAQATKAVAPIGQGFVDRGAARYNADVYRTQAQQTVQAAAEDETAARREGRAAIASQIAGASAEGQGDSSAADVIRQNEVNLIRDALMIRARGDRQASGLKSRAAMSEYEGDQALYEGIQGTGASLLTTAGERRAKELSLERARARRKGGS
jgi:hypothetical protein